MGRGSFYLLEYHTIAGLVNKRKESLAAFAAKFPAAFSGEFAAAFAGEFGCGIRPNFAVMFAANCKI